MTTLEKRYIEKLKEAFYYSVHRDNRYHTFWDKIEEFESEIASLEQQVEQEEIQLTNWKHLPEGKYKDHGWQIPNGNQIDQVKQIEQENNKEGCICQNCGGKYKMDILVSVDLWNKIRPANKDGEGGLLCPTCIVNAVEKIKGFSAFELVEKQVEKTVSDIIDCITSFDKTETLEIKGRYFEVIQRDLCKLLNK